MTTESTTPNTTTSSSAEYENSVHKALAWLVSQRESDWGWRNDTPKVITALQLVQNDDLRSLLPSHIEMQLSAKQMEVEVVVLLWRWVRTDSFYSNLDKNSTQHEHLFYFS